MQIIIQAVVLRFVTVEPVMLALYTQRYGRITVHDVSRKKQWQAARVGDICYATIGHRGNRWFLYDLESVVTYAMSADTQTFFWHHHILDMYFYYVPLEQPSAHLFALITQAIQIARADDVIFKLLIVHFFALLGYHVPDFLRWYRLVLVQLEMHTSEFRPIMTLNDAVVPSESAVALNNWIVTMLKQHDHFQYLKTQQFLPQLYSISGL